MRIRSRWLLGMVAFVLILGVLALAPSAPAPTSAQLAAPDDEIAYIDSGSFIQIKDPVTPPGQAKFEPRSPTGGWTNMAALDANGDGINEIVSIGGNTVHIWAPFTPSGTVVPSWTQSIPTGFVYNWVATGDIVPGDGGRDEIVLQRTDSRNGAGYSVQIYDGDDTGTIWTPIFDSAYGVPWLRIATGEYNGLAGDEVVMMRNGIPPDQSDERVLVLSRTANGAFATFAERTFDFPFVDLATGNTHLNNGDLVELQITRDVIGLASFLVFQYQSPTATMVDAPNGNSAHYPPFTDIATGDVNASGDDEVFLIRDPQQDAGISMIGRNWGSDPFPAGWENPGLQLGRDLKAVVTGDVDGDGKAEVVTAKSTSYRIWWQPDIDTTTTSGDLPAAFRDPVVMVTGNFDGNGLQPPSLAVNKTTLTFQMQRGGSNPPPQTFEVSNAGGSGSITYQINQQPTDWLSVNPFEGTTPGTHTVSINGAGLTPGTYQGQITVTALGSGVENSPRTINVQLTVVATGPILEVTPNTLSYDYNFGGIVPDPRALNIKNVGDGGSQFYQLTVTTADGSNWLQTDKRNGHTNDVVQVTLRPRISSRALTRVPSESMPATSRTALTTCR